ncbi:hypothetical protein, partial [Glutamicibacter arilaitensis]|uniref:hypothetical protein n=1 Tax=Glutamicibacter arilaitensis TaxID=256701 RepID=UPI003FD51075
NGTIIQKGAIYTRQSAQNVIASSNDLRRLLDPFRSVAFDEGRSHVDELIRTLTQTFAGANGGAPMIIDSDIASFADALRSNLDYDNVKQIESFIRDARRQLSYHPGDDARRDRQRILDKLALLAIETCEEPDGPLFTAVLKALTTSYKSTGFMSDSTRITNAEQVQMARHFIDVLVRVYLIGAAAVRENNLHAVQAVSMVPVQNGTDAFSNYSSWIRHGITYASRANLLSSESDSQTLLAMARQLGHDVPELVTGLSNDLTERESDSLLSDMTSFDIMWCMAAAATTTAGNETYEMYTSFASVNPRRGEMILIRLATDAESRQTLAPPATDADFARSLDHVLNLARTESYRYNTFWSRAQDIPEVANFIKTHKESA